MIYVKAYADLAEYLKVTEIGETVEYNNSGIFTVVEKIADFYSIPHEKISIILINGEYGEMGSLLKDNDNIVFFSPIDGG